MSRVNRAQLLDTAGSHIAPPPAAHRGGLDLASRRLRGRRAGLALLAVCATAWLLSPDMKLPGQMRLKESRRVPMWNGPIECRLFRFDMVAGSNKPATQPQAEA